MPIHLGPTAEKIEAVIRNFPNTGHQEAEALARTLAQELDAVHAALERMPNEVIDRLNEAAERLQETPQG